MDTTQTRVRQVLIIGGAIFVIAMSYGSGMRAQVKKIQKQYEDVKIYRQEARVAQLTAQARDAQLHQLEARRLLDVAQDALSKGDAAKAKAAATEAVTRLQTAQKADAATAADFSGLADDLAHVNFSDTAAARLALVGFAAAMDEKFAQVNGLPAPDALTSVTIPPPTDNDKPVLGHDMNQTD